MTLLAERPGSEPRNKAFQVVDLTSYEDFAGRKRFTREDCDFLERVEVLTERYELIDGEIIVKMGNKPPHALVMTLLSEWLTSVFGAKYVYNQAEIEIGAEDRSTSRPQPDLAVLARPVTEFATAVVGPGDIRLVVEVSDTTLSQDLRTKAALYARAGIPEYWVADIVGRRFFVHTGPDLEHGGYMSVTTYGEFDSLAALAAPEHSLVVGSVLPPQ